jgi:Fic family protein
LEAKAHIAVQEWIDEGGMRGRQTEPEALRELHSRFCDQLPEEMLWVEHPATGERIRVEPGEYRRDEVAVGRHVAVSPGAIPRFLERFHAVYGSQGKAEGILACAAAHHRLLWVHPFLDGNGRVARLMSHATMLELLETGGVWSVARGFARNVQEYKRLLAQCDEPRRGDLDGRGSLSEVALAEFTEFFLRTSLDQVAFMESLVQPDRLRTRVLLWAEEEVRLGALPARSTAVLEAVLHRGELPRGDVETVSATGARQGRRIVAALIERGVLRSDGMRAPLRLAFPAALAGRWLPGLFPEL